MTFTVLHCIVQVALQSDAYVQNSSADSFLKAIVRAAGIPTPPGINILVKDGPLYLCQSNPGANWSGCETVWAPKKAGAGTGVNATGTGTGSTTSAWNDGYYSSSGYTDAAYAAAISTSTSSVSATSTSSVSVVKSTQVCTNTSIGCLRLTPTANIRSFVC